MKEAFIDIRKQLEKKLKKDRFEHTIGVMYTAASLAMRYHEDIDDAMMAGLLHDCGKYGSAQEQVERCQKHGILLTQSELEMPALVHAKLGAYFAEKEYGVTNKGVLSAITWHTTGRPEMTMLEKIIYIADYIEPNRKIILVFRRSVKLCLSILTTQSVFVQGIRLIICVRMVSR